MNQITTSLAHGWTLHGDGIPPTPASVPGYVHLDLMRAGIIPDPHKQMWERSCQWVDELNWVYSCEFEFTPHADLPFTELVFPGLDTFCMICIDGQAVAKTANAFLPCRIDLSKLILPGKHTLTLQFESAVKKGRALRQDYFSKHGLPLETKCFDERAFVRKPQYMFGWDWGPRLVSCGITAVPYLHQYRSRIDRILLDQNYSGSPCLSVDVKMAGQEGVPTIQFAGETIQGSSATFSTGRLDRWFPRNYGNPVLHPLTIGIEGESRIYPVGLRKVELVQEPDEFGKSFEFSINDQKVYALGANWIPEASFPLENEHHKKSLELLDQIGSNMVRIWGGGLFGSDTLYRHCDANGIMVWQDFPYACSYYPDDPEHLSVARAEAEHHLARISRFASLTLLCGNNENSQMHFDRWAGSTTPDRHFGEHLYDELGKVSAAILPQVPYIPTSAGGMDESLASEGNPLNPNMGKIGDSHYWDVWHERGDWNYYRDSLARFSSEFGFCSCPGIATLRDAIAPDQWEAFSDQMNWHNKTGKPVELFRQMVELHYPEARCLEEWMYYSQLNQRDAMRCAIGHWRSSEFCKGILIWQLNDCWPVQSWSLFDSMLHPKAAANLVKEMYRPYLLHLDREGSSVKLWAINDSPEAYRFKGSVIATDLTDGTSQIEWQVDTMQEPGRKKLKEWNASTWSPSTALHLESDIANSWTLLCEPKELSIPAVPATYHRTTSELHFSGPAVDCLISNGKEEPIWFTCFERSVMKLSPTHDPSGITVRSLAGMHEILVID